VWAAVSSRTSPSSTMSCALSSSPRSYLRATGTPLT
jgi:hypothetical protein